MEFPLAFSLTILLETIVLLFLMKTRDPFSIIRNALIVNIITHPIVWFVFPLFGLYYPLQITLSEIFAVGAETLLYSQLFPKLSLRHAFFIALACNFVSFITGFFLLQYLS